MDRLHRLHLQTNGKPQSILAPHVKIALSPAVAMWTLHNTVCVHLFSIIGTIEALCALPRAAVAARLLACADGCLEHASNKTRAVVR